MKFLKPSPVLLVHAIVAVTTLLFVNGSALGIPSIKDHWRFFCSPGTVNQNAVAKAKGRAETTTGLQAGINILNYACLLSAFEIQQYQEKLVAFKEKGGTGNPPQLDARPSTGQARRALKVLANAHRSRKNDPKTIYHYGYALALANDSLAVNMFDDLMTNHKGSPFTQDAYLALGEYYFDNGDAQKAFREYNVAIKSKKRIVQSYARYKITWINLATAAQANDQAKKKKSIMDLVTLAKRTGAGKNKYMKKLANQIKDDLIGLLAELGNFQEAKQILVSLNAQDVYAGLLEKMAFTKINAGDSQGAYNLFALSLKEDPLRADALQISNNLVVLAAQLNNVPALIANLKNMTITYCGKKSAWRKKNKPLQKKARQTVEGLVFEYATAMDRQGRDTGNNLYINGALELYVLYLRNFGKAPRAYEMKVFYGQLLYQLQKYPQMIKLYLGLLKKQPKGKGTKDVAELLVTAAQVQMDADKTQYKLPEPGTALTPEKIPAVRKMYADSLDAFVKVMPGNENSAAMMFASGSVYYDFGHYKDAIPRYYKYLDKHPTHDFSKVAAARILTYYDRQVDLKGLKKAKKKIGSIPGMRSSPEIAPFFVKKKKKKPTKPPKKPKPEAEPENTATDEANSSQEEAKGQSEENTQSNNEESSDE